MTDIGVLLGGSYNETKVQMYKVIEFEQKLANVSITLVVIRNGCIFSISVNE